MMGLALSLVALPLLAGVLVSLTVRGLHPSTAHLVALAATGLTALCAVTLLLHAGDGLAVAVEWLPGTGAMEWVISGTGLSALLVTTWGAFLTLLATRSHSAQGPRLSKTVTLLALAAANAAFLAEHFLARYVALEVVALCIALALVVEGQRPAGVRQAWSSYLLLRLGDAGLLIAILILMDASGTLSIGPALERAQSSIGATGSTLGGARLGWMVAGFLVAVWVKLGGWPFHLWVQPSRGLSLASQAWLYATVMPNLGAYLLYRVSPLLAVASVPRTAALWLGAGGAALAVVVALSQADLRAALVYLGAAQGGLVLFVAASGVNAAIWVGLLALTPLRLLLFLAGDTALGCRSAIQRRVAAGLFALGGLALAAFGLVITWWARGGGAPLDTLFVAEVGVGLTGVWAVRTTRQLRSAATGTAMREAVHWTRWAAVGLLGGVVLAGVLAFGPLARCLAISPAALPAIPALSALLRHAVTAPALLAVAVLVLAVWRLQRRSKWSPLVSVEPAQEVYDLEEGLARAAQALYAVVEVGILEQVVALVVRGVVEGAYVTYRVVEQEGLEGLLRRSVRAVLAVSRRLQSGHTGRLRHNLLWVVVTLAVALLALLLRGG